jgi:hypothetical protein
MNNYIINNFKAFSTEYYDSFKESDFPKTIEFNKPYKIKFKKSHLVAGSNKFYLVYVLEGGQPQDNNPYSGDIPEKITIDVGFTYKEEGTKIYVTIIGGVRNWYGFSYEDKKVKDIEVTEYKLTKGSKDKLIKSLNKYSKN